MAVATRQKSTARRLVSSRFAARASPADLPRQVAGGIPLGGNCAALEGTYPMLFSGGAAVTTWTVNTAPVAA